MTSGLDEDVVDFAPNYDGRELEPVVLPAAIPNLLVNGASGIAVGMATNLVPHNLGEAIGAARHLIQHPKASLDDVMRFVPGPDLPGGGVIIGLEGIRDAYATGRGSFRVRARTRIENVSPRRRGIVVTELPMNVGPERVIERIKDLVQAKKLQGIADIADLTDGDSGLNLVIEVKNGFNPEAVLDSLFRLTPMEDQVSINAVALVDGQPQTMGLLDMLRVFVEHRLEVTRRRSAFRRAKAHDRLHLVEGLLIAILDIDEVIQLIRQSEDASAARARLMTVFDLSEPQANYILDMPLRRLTKFSRLELEREGDELRREIEDLDAILSDDRRLRAVASDELAQVAQAHATSRRTLLMEDSAVPVAASVPLEVGDAPCLVMMSSTGLLARTTEGSFESGGTRAAHDVITSTCPATTRGHVGLVTSTGRVVRVSVLDIPGIPPTADIPALSAGTPIGALVDLPRDERVLGLMPLDGSGTLALVTAWGVVKRVLPEIPSNKDSWDVIRLDEQDWVVGAAWLDEDSAERGEFVCITSDAQLLRFPASAVRPQGRAAAGMQGIRVYEDAEVVFGGVVLPSDAAVVVTVAGSFASLAGTDAGSTKVSELAEYPAKGRGTAGVRCHKLRSGEDGLLRAWAGTGPARAAAESGTPIDLPSEMGKRDGTGTPGSVPIAGLAGSIGPIR
jgi:DNA gyrase subunit A